MSRRVVTLGVLAVLLAALAAFVLARGGPRRAPSSARVADRTADADSEGGGADGVRARSNDSAARHVRGRVVDAHGEPVDEGTVSLRCLDDDDEPVSLGPAIVLDEAGAFEAPGCNGVVCAELHHPSLVRASAWVLEPGTPAELVAGTLPRLVGTVEDPRGAPVAAAQLSFVAADPGEEGLVPTAARATTTDEDGAFAIALVRRPPCDPCTEASPGCDEAPLPWVSRLAVVAVAERFAPARVEIELDPEGDPAPLEIRLAPPADTLSGTLTDPRGEPYPRAQVLARSQLRPSEQHHSVPVGDTFVFEALGDGPYDLRALQDGVELATAAGALAGEDVALHGVRVASGPDVIVEVQQGGRPRADVAVDGGPFRGARTDMHGQVRAEQAMPGDYTLLLRPSGGRGSRHAITIEPLDAGAPGPGAPAPTRIEIELPAAPQR